ncbi:MAG: polyprenyl synthetase family protein [Gemmatimonadales bacterium]
MPPQIAPVALASIQQPVKQELDAVFEELARAIETDFSLIADVNAHLLQIRGKMFRPTLVLLSAQAADAVTDRHVRLAAAVELIHLATLIHDDSVDHSVLRRGQPTVNALFSHQKAVIMGDYLYSRAIIQLVDLDALEPLRVMSRVTNEMTVGEMREIEAHDGLDFTEEDYDCLINAKTASLISGACEVGALDHEHRDTFRRFGRSLGMAFQIVDDLLDYTGSEDVTGKPAGLDLREHKITLPLIAAIPNMDPGERTIAEDLMATATPTDAQIHEVITIVEERGGIEAAVARASHFASEAEAELDRIPVSRARDVLRDAVSYVVERRS